MNGCAPIKLNNTYGELDLVCSLDFADPILEGGVEGGLKNGTLYTLAKASSTRWKTFTNHSLA